MESMRFSLSVAAFAIGVAAALNLPDLPQGRWLVLAALLLILGWWRSGAGSTGRWHRLVLACGAGLVWSLGYALLLHPQPLPNELAGRDLVVEGRTVGLPAGDERRRRFEFIVTDARSASGPVSVPRHVLLSWRDVDHPLIPGQHWRLQVRLKPPHGLMNPGGWDYERWLFERGIGARGTVRRSADNLLLAPPGMAGWLDRLRLHVRENLRQRFSDPRIAALAVALTIGDRSLLGHEERERFARVGVSHLIAISGLHVGIVAALCFIVAQRLWRVSGCLMRWCPASLAATVAGLCGALLYALLSGFGIPARRALLMLVVVAGALLGRRVVRPLRTLSLAALVVLICDPFALLSPGFWLSFAAVGLILLALAGRPRGKLAAFLRIQGFIGVGLAPLLLLFFAQVSVIAPFANLVLIPLFSVLVIPLLLLLLPGAFVDAVPFDALAWLLEYLLGISLDFIDWLAGLDWAAWSPGGMNSAWLWPLAGAVLLVLLPRGLPGRALAGVPLLMGLALPLHDGGRVVPGVFVVEVVDVGQGSAVVVRTAGHVLVHDTGPAYPGGRAAAWYSLLPLLRERGVTRIDTLVLSHDDSDHSGGARLLRDRFEVVETLSGEPVLRYPEPTRPCVAGRHWRWDGVNFEVLWPYAPDFWSGNNASCVIRVDNGRYALLLTGDIEAPVESQLVRRYRDRLRADIVIAPHHGSRTSSSAGFVAATRATLTLFTTGFMNRWGFPKPDRVARWSASGSRVLAVSDSGAVQLVLGHGAAEVNCFRARRRRFWHHGRVPMACGTELTPRSDVE